MAWFITGNADQIIIGHNNSGASSVWGGGSHEPKPVLDTYAHSDLSYLKAAECSWSILPSDASDIDIDLNGEGLLPLVRQAPTNVHVAIRFLDNSPLVGFTIVLPVARFFETRELLRTVLISEQLGFSITVDFPGFPAEHATISIPTAREFLAGKPYFSSGVSFAIGRRFHHA